MSRSAPLALLVTVAALAAAGTPAQAAAYQCVGTQFRLYDNWNVQGTQTGGKPPTFNTGGKAYCLDTIATYHFNGGTGKAPGRISLVGGGTTLGPYKAVSDSSPPYNWIAAVPGSPQPVVIDGTYQCRDSDPATWAQNGASSGRGFCRVFVRQAEVVSTELSGTLTAGASRVTANVTVGGTQTQTAIRLDLNPAVHHTGALATVDGNPQGSCGPYQGSTTNLICSGLTAAPGSQVAIDVGLDAPYPDNGGADAYGDPGTGLVGPFSLTGPSPAGQPPPAAVAPPTEQKNANAKPVSGSVLVEQPGTTTFAPLATTQSVPFGAVVDARLGRVQIRVRGDGGVIQVLDAYEGEFKLVQLKEKGHLIAELQLFDGNFTVCPRAQRGTGVKPAAKPKSVRHLWAEGAGSFRTRGRFSSAAIRGTNWLTDDRCDGTLTRVAQGAVAVRDFVKRKTVVVRAPKSYLAKARRR